MDNKSRTISAFLMCLREDIDRSEFVLIDNDNPFATTLQFSSNPDVVAEIKVVTSSPPTFTIEYIAISNGQIMEVAKEGAILNYDLCLAELKHRYGL